MRIISTAAHLIPDGKQFYWSRGDHGAPFAAEWSLGVLGQNESDSRSPAAPHRVSYRLCGITFKISR